MPLGCLAAAEGYVLTSNLRGKNADIHEIGHRLQVPKIWPTPRRGVAAVKGAGAMTPKELAKFKFDHYASMMRDGNLSAVDLKVAWLLLFKYMNTKTMTAWPSAETMAEDIGASVRTVRRSIRRLTTAGGYFTVDPGGGRGQSNRYSPSTLTVTDTSPFCDEETVTDTSPINEERVTQTVLKGDSGGQETVTDMSPEPFYMNPTRTLEREARARGPTNSHSSEQGTRIDPAWQPGLAECEVGYELGLDDRGITAEADKFRDYYLGNGEKREDWNAVFRTWLRRSPSYEGRGQGRASANTQEQDRTGMMAAMRDVAAMSDSSQPARMEAAEAAMKEARDRRRAVELRQKIQWFEGQQTKLETPFAEPIAAAKAELDGILSRLSGECNA